MTTSTAIVWTEVRVPGFHHWPAAPEHRSYLRARHRHLFHLQARIHVDHDDRAFEFHDLQDVIRAWWGPGDRECGAASCELLARSLAGHLAALGLRVEQVSVSEDGEAGAIVRPVPEARP
ncbi:hypothetical protein LN042_18850 [Kitasatospora sp. RB6PN24]|uniref:hypothetical protein n=1 Tax=Kitasatospora humi TaxID=2893891 RepID=UPI001E56F3DE|nr:hypothetical protein [Kitasatospora humi]MCC9309115.1 hypothetical protein [Kitasatospora humi]